MTRALIPLAMGLMVVACATTEQHIGGAPAAFVGKEWVVEDLAGRGIVDDSRITLTFAADGRISGSGGCNRLIGNYVRRGDKITIAAPGMTMMACPPALMEQERRFADVLGRVQRYGVDRTGALVLTTGDGRTITAR